MTPWMQSVKLPMMVNFCEKAKRHKALNFSEESEFSGICRMGAQQLINCYSDKDLPLSAFDVAHGCKRCEFCMMVDKRNDLYESIAFPFFIETLLPGVVCDENPKAYVYFMTDGEFVKIGVAENPTKRAVEIQTGSPREISVICAIPCKTKNAAFNLENKLHSVYGFARVRGEWFNIKKLIDKVIFSRYYKWEVEHVDRDGLDESDTR